MSDPKTRVLFRADKSGSHKGDITAVFPDLPYDAEGSLVTCYAHVGQHSGCDRSWVRESTRPAKPAEYEALKRELESIGYTLRIVGRL